MKNWFIKFIFFTLCLTLPLAAGEIFIRVLIAPTLADKESFLAKLQSIPADNFKSYEGPQMAEHIAHPFWGHQANPHLPGVNNFGFRESENLPYNKKTNEFVIGLFGGSVAALNYPFLKSTLEKPGLFLKCDRKLKLLNFSAEAYSQPSQMHIAAYFAEQLNASINIDGNNEVTTTRSFRLPANFPEFYHDLYNLSAAKQRHLNKAFNWERRRQQLAQAILNAPFILKSDLIYYLALKAETFTEAEKFQQLYLAAEATPTIQPDGPELTKMRQGLATWEKYTLLQSGIAQRNKMPALFFIQPSQYAANEKSLTTLERAHAIESDLERLRNLKTIFTELQASGLKLKKEGVSIFDLTSLFSADGEDIFIDTCCHINDRGNHILAEKMAKEVIAEINKLPCKQEAL